MKRLIFYITFPTLVVGLTLLMILGVTSLPDATPPLDAVEREYWPVEGWFKARPEDHGMDRTLLQQGDRYLQHNYPNIVSFTVVRNGYIVWESFFGGNTYFTINHNLHSATKSVVSTLVGIALKEGSLKGMDQTLLEAAPGLFREGRHPDKESLTIRDLVTMRSGLHWEEISPGLVLNLRQGIVDQLLNLPQDNRPGETFNYSSADYHILAGVLTEATGQDLLSYTGEKLFEPLGILNRQWSQDLQGIEFGGTGLHLTSRDLAAIGLLYLDGGYWNGKWILDKDWVQEATSPQVSLRPADNPYGLSKIEYGYGWWLRDQGNFESFMAVGYGGQYIVVIPELDMVVVMTAVPLPWLTPKEMQGTGEVDFDFFERFVLPAVVDPPR